MLAGSDELGALALEFVAAAEARYGTRGGVMAAAEAFRRAALGRYQVFLDTQVGRRFDARDEMKLWAHGVNEDLRALDLWVENQDGFQGRLTVSPGGQLLGYFTVGGARSVRGLGARLAEVPQLSLNVR